ncbi:unnamed protein product [Strongylus vulgaris]|uniref:Uncharacterized protein n=1 Tax=Strongylus vulgaris TaxID=40348 RepID=A0A3P7M2S0_STRVU|nr:unnamed protein product [Strongylus vulgaris]
MYFILYCTTASIGVEPQVEATQRKQARHSLSFFTDKRSQLYEEEILVAQLKKKKLELDIEKRMLQLEEAKIKLELAKKACESSVTTASGGT